MRVNGFRLGYSLIILLLVLLSIQYGVKIYDGGHAWKTADWLIHYDAGIVRRGFMGTLFLFLSDAFSVPVQWICYFFQVSFLGMLAFFVLKAFYRFHLVPHSIYWLWAPAFIFLFWINHTTTSFRKEILLYIALVFTLKAFVRTFHRHFYWLGVISFLVAGLSHESAIFFLPFFLFPIVDYSLREKKEWWFIFWHLLPLVVSALLILSFALYFSATESHIYQICHALDRFHLRKDFCDGAIKWLQYDAVYGHQKVLELGWQVWLNYLLLLGLAFLPILLLKRDTLFNRLLVCALLCALPLFLIAIDYGRWISILYTSSFLTIIWLRPALIEKGVSIKPLWMFIYCFSWVLPNFGAVLPHKGVLSRLFLLPFGL